MCTHLKEKDNISETKFLQRYCFIFDLLRISTVKILLLIKSLRLFAFNRGDIG